jgi:ArsR family transcriptional regulator, arsenate/arsenite/antimonite-responsive transcriptional repressor
MAAKTRAGTKKTSAEQVAKYADMFTAMGPEPRLRIMQLLLSAHPDGLVVGDIQTELGIPNSTLSHHLEKLKNEDLVKVRRESTFLWYTANTEAWRNCSASSMPSAALATRPSNPKQSSLFVNRK